MNNIVERIKNTMVIDENILLPKSLKIELVNICNHKCKYCVVPYVKESNHFMSDEIFYKAVQEAYRLNITEIGLFHMGEGTLHPKFNDYIDYIRDNYPNINIFITSNGTQLNKLKHCIKKNINSIKISLNGYNKQFHKDVTGVDTFELIMDHINQLVEYRNTINSSTQISASSIYYNSPEQEHFVQNISKVVDCFYYTEIFTHAGKVNNTHIELSNDDRIIKNFVSLPCNGMYNLCHIKVNGDINLCKWGVDNEFVIGNIMNDDIQTLWSSDKVKQLRYKANNHLLDTCNRCVGISNGL